VSSPPPPSPDPDVTRIRPVFAPDPEATRQLRPVVPRDDDATRVQLPPAADPDATRVLAAPDPAVDPDATQVRTGAPTGPRSGPAAPASAADTTRRQRTTLFPATKPLHAHTTVLRRGEAPPPALPEALARKAPLALQAGFRLHEYRIERVLGQGGFGITYLATDVNLRAPVAIKEYLPEEIAFRTGDRSVLPVGSQHKDRYQFGLEAFLVEARTLASFRHPNIVRVARFFEAHHTAYMVLEYEQGSPLREWWPQHQALGEKGLVARLQPLLDGLATVHAAGFLHRDIKPDNIQVRQEDGRFVLLDFGSSGQTVALATEEAVIVTPGFAPIEQYGYGEQGAWTDIYALGATLYWAVSGHKPPDAEARASGTAMKPAVQAGQGRYGEVFLRAIDWALEPKAADRPRDVAQWRAALLAEHLQSLGLKEALQGGDEAAEARGARSWARRSLAALRLAFNPPSWPLAFKLTLAMVLTALLPMLLTSAWNLDRSQQALTDSQLRQAELLAHNAAGRLGQLITDSQNLARVLGSDTEFTAWLAWPDEAFKPALQARLVALAKSNPDVHLVMVMDAEGTAQVSNDPEVMGRKFQFRQYFQEALAGRPFITSIVVGSVAGAAGVFFSVPVQGPSGKVIGVVVLRIHAAAFEKILDEVSHEMPLTPFLIDGDGVLLDHPRAELVYRSLGTLSAEQMAAIKADQRFRRDTIESQNQPDLARAMVGARAAGNVSYRSTVSGVDEVAGFAPVRGHNWVVGVSEPRAQFEAPVRELYTQLLWSVALVGLLFTGLALRFARSIVRPIKALTGAADALKEGDFDRATVTVRSSDEVGQLARTFNVMIDVLRQREREREAAASERKR
jgi:serine/threonine protein kinase/HAMP domain-containing protein